MIKKNGKWYMETGDSCYWVGEDRTAYLAKIILISKTRVFVEATAARGNVKKGAKWFTMILTDRVAPRDAYVNKGKVYFNSDSVAFIPDPEPSY